MKLTFFGAAKAVTGSCHCLEVRGKKILVDCGLQQGRDERDNSILDFSPSEIDYVIVTHAHIDHSGRIPLLVKKGFHGQIFTTRLTGEILSVMLQDSAHIQEMEAQWKNEKGKRTGREPVEPLYTVAEAVQTMAQVVTFEYDEIIEVIPGVKIRFVDAGHLLGSASVEVWASEEGVEKKIVFSGDIGNINQPVIRDPVFLKGADYVVMESTYGDRNHQPVPSYTAELAKIIDDTFAKGGNVIIPSFAVGRTQELLYFMREMKRDGLVKSDPDFAVVVDSPLANVATKIFSGDLRGYLDEEAIELVREGEQLFTFPGLTMTETSEESKLLNMDKRSKVIISASGMCDAGRIRHHLKHNLWREECSVVFVGYQGEGTLGRHLLEGAKKVHLFGEDIVVNASIHNIKGLSSHADRDHLLEWISQINDPAPSHVFVVHGEARVTEIFADSLRERGIPAHAALYEEVYDLAANKMLAAGVELAPKKISFESSGRVNAAYQELEETAMDLMILLRANKGSPNKDLKRMTNQLKQVIDQLKVVMDRWKD